LFYGITSFNYEIRKLVPGMQSVAALSLIKFWDYTFA